MILGIVAAAGDRVILVMGENRFVGSFTSHTHPFASFKWDEETDPIYVQIERIDAIIPLREENGLGGIIDASSEQVGNILGKHSAEINGKT